MSEAALIKERERAALLDLLAAAPEGLGIAALHAAAEACLGRTLNRRTLQRRLDQLQTEGRVETMGVSVARRYRLTVGGPAPLGAVPQALEPLASCQLGEPEPEAYIPLSAEAFELRALVRRPLMHRRPVGYDRGFLERYQPGVTFYLDEKIREQLHLMGRTSSAQRPAGTHARDMLGRLLVDLSWASSRLEGNTYTRLDTLRLIELGQEASGKDRRETQMILNHKAAIEMLVEDADEVGFDTYTFQNLHALLSQNLMADDAACGRVRWRPVEIAGTVFLPLAVPQLLEDCFRLLLDKAAAIPDPFEQAFFLMVQLPYLQPFEDVNKRVSRIGANIPLIRNNLCPLSFIDVPETSYIDATLAVYELQRVDLLREVFFWAYERSCQRYLAITQSLVDPDPLKMRYREELIEAVQDVVRQGLQPSPVLLQEMASQRVPVQDADAFADLLGEALVNLHEGSVARFRLRRSEFLTWSNIRASKT